MFPVTEDAPGAGQAAGVVSGVGRGSALHAHRLALRLTATALGRDGAQQRHHQLLPGGC